MRMKKQIRKSTAAASIVLMLCAAVAPAYAGTPADDLKQIEYKYYFRGKYPGAIEALRTFLARVDVTGAVAVRASEFLAASHVLSGAPDAGKDVFAGLIAKDSAYAGPDAAVFKPEVVDVYAQARSEYASLMLKNPPIASADSTLTPTGPPAANVTHAASKPIYKKWWFYAGAATIVGVVAGVAGSGGSDAARPATGTVAIGVQVK
jgi:hypothetical protein